jgi:hypothetical protein
VPGPLFANISAGAESEGAGDHPASLAEGDAEPCVDGSPAEPRSPGSPSGESPPKPSSPPRDANGETNRDAANSPVAVGTLSTVSGRRRPGRYGLLVQFESRPGDPELGRLVDSTIWINDAHPAYVRATASRSAGYHIALTVALALAPLAVGTGGEHAFLTRFLAEWGGANRQARRRVRREGRGS